MKKTSQKAIGIFAKKLTNFAEPAWSCRKYSTPQRGGAVPTSTASDIFLVSHSGLEMLRLSKTWKQHKNWIKLVTVARGSSRFNSLTVGKKWLKMVQVLVSLKGWVENEWRERQVMDLNAVNRGRIGYSIWGAIHVNKGYWTKHNSHAWIVAERSPKKLTSEVDFGQGPIRNRTLCRLSQPQKVRPRVCGGDSHNNGFEEPFQRSVPPGLRYHWVMPQRGWIVL